MSAQEVNDDVKESMAIPETVQQWNSGSDDGISQPCDRGTRLTHHQAEHRSIKWAELNDHFNSLVIKILQNDICRTHEPSTTFTLLDQPQKTIRPMYASEGNRGALKARNGKHLQLQTTISISEDITAMVIVSLVNENGENARDFILSVAERQQNTCEIINEMQNCIVQFIDGDAESEIDLHSIHIKRRSTKKTKDLEKTCRLYFRLVVAANCDHLVEIADLYSEKFHIEQPFGPPKIDKLTQLDDSHLLAVEGKNFKKGSTKIYFEGEEAEVLIMNKEMVICCIPQRFCFQIPHKKIFICAQVDSRKSEPKGIKINPKSSLKRADLNLIAAHQFGGMNTLSANFCPDFVPPAPEDFSQQYDSQLWQTFNAGDLFSQDYNTSDWFDSNKKSL